jgi:hypothetical protein
VRGTLTPTLSQRERESLWRLRERGSLWGLRERESLWRRSMKVIRWYLIRQERNWQLCNHLVRVADANRAVVRHVADHLGM